MACACGNSGGTPATEYVIRTQTGQVKTFSSKVAADIEVTRGGTVIEVKKPQS